MMKADALRAVSINKKHQEVVPLGRAAKEIAAEIGEDLIAVKANPGIKHGQFKPWVAEHCTFKYDTANDYMKVAKAKMESAPLFQRCTSVREVLAIGKTKQRRDEKPDTRAATLVDLRKVERLRALRDDPSTTEGEKRATQHVHVKKFSRKGDT